MDLHRIGGLRVGTRSRLEGLVDQTRGGLHRSRFLRRLVDEILSLFLFIRGPCGYPRAGEFLDLGGHALGIHRRFGPGGSILEPAVHDLQLIRGQLHLLDVAAQHYPHGIEGLLFVGLQL